MNEDASWRDDSGDADAIENLDETFVVHDVEMGDENYVVETVLEDDNEKEEYVEFIGEDKAAGDMINKNKECHDVMKYVDDDIHSDELLNDLEEMNAEGINFDYFEQMMDETIGNEQIGGGVEKILSPNADFHLVHCLELDDAVVDGDENEMDNMIPTTAYGQNPFNVDVKGQYISGHVILNNCGRSLARKHGKLRGTTRQRNFLE